MKNQPLPLKYSIERGFTLIELMVVMVIVSVLITAVSMTLKRDYQDLAIKEMKRFRALVDLAGQESVFQARSLGMRFVQDGYAFMARGDGGQWLPMEGSNLRQRKLPKGFELEVFREGVAINYLEKTEGKPQVFILPTNEVTPFEMSISYPGRALIRVRYDYLGNSSLVTEE